MSAETSDPTFPDRALTDAEVEELLFDAASVFSTDEERERFLAFACRGEAELAARIRRLFGRLSDADDFFEFEPQVKAGESAEGAEDDLDGMGVEVGRYRLLERIGAGGCGVVYLAEQREPVRRKVALKIIRLGLENPESVARFEAERQALASMNHPNIARVLDAGTHGSGRPFFVMELVDGVAITDYCDSRKLDVRERLRLFVRVCNAIQHAHQRGVVHRDIKPSNVLVEVHESTPEPKVIDFGIAQESEVAARGGAVDLVGTPAYMSPEQATGDHPVDTRSDIYSLGMLLGELLAGPHMHLPADLMERDPDELRRIMAETSPRLPSATLDSQGEQERLQVGGDRTTPVGRLLVWCRRDLDWIVRKAIHRNPDRRYDTAAALAADVQRWLQGEAVSARPQGRGYRLAKLIRRNRLLYGAGALAFAGLVAGLGVATVLFLREREARAAQERMRVQAEDAHLAEKTTRERWEYRSRVAEAAVRLRYGDIEGAEEQVEAIPLKEIPASLETVAVFQELAEWHRAGGREKKAERRFLAMAYALARTDRMHTDNNSNYFLPASAALAGWSETERYDQLRQLALDLYGDTDDRLVAERILKACLLKPAPEGVLRRTGELAGVLTHGLPGSPEEVAGIGNMDAWERFAVALHHYRAGELDLAESWALSVLELEDENRANEPLANALIGLIYQQSGRPADARRHLDQAEKIASDHMGKPLPYGTMATGFWYDWENVKTLLEEAGRHQAEDRTPSAKRAPLSDSGEDFR